jgi:multicomponent Na+:H+ antiporter subunit D
MISAETAILWSMIVPFIGFIAIWLLGKSPNLREAATLVTGVILLALTIVVFMAVGDGARPEVELFNVVSGLPIAFKVEPLGAVFALLASGLWIVNSLYSIGYMRGHDEPHQTRFYMCFAIAIGSAVGVAFAANLFTLFVFYEILTISTFPLVTHKGDDAARNGGRVYLGILMGTSIGLLLPAIVWTFALTGTTDFTPGGILATHVDEAGPIVAILLGLFAFGIGKAALMPIHPWLPNAMVAPTPVSAFLHAVAVVKAGVFSILKVVVYIFGTDILNRTGAADFYLWIAAISIILASAIAMHKDNLKARLAYSTVSQLSYVTLGAMLATQMGVMGGALQIVTHAFGKMTLFMCAGAIYVAAHKTLISEMRGLGRVMPFTFGAFFIGAMSIIGLPPLGGAWPKFFLLMAAADTHHIILMGVLLLSSLMNVIYLLSIPLQAFMKPKPGEAHPKEADWYAGNLHDQPLYPGAGGAKAVIKEAPFFCLLPIAITSIGCVALFLLADPLYTYLLPLIEGGAR